MNSTSDIAPVESDAASRDTSLGDGASVAVERFEDPPGFAATWRKRIGKAAMGGLLLYLVIGSVLRVTIQDRALAAATFYYGAPSILLSIAGGLAAIGSWRRKWSGLWMCVFLAAGACWGAWWWHTAHVANPEHPLEDPLRLVFWNTARGALGMDGVFDELLSYDADMIGIVEAGEDHALNEATWRRQFPEHEMTGIGGQITFLVKGQFVDQKNVSVGRIGFVKIYDLRIRGRLVTAMVVDIAAQPFYSRDAPIRELSEAVRARSDRPVIVVGDFNTPGDSVHFAPLRKVCRNAFEVAGHGHTATWPVPFPLIHIDHVWVNEHVRIGSCRYGWSWHSDHRPILVELDF